MSKKGELKTDAEITVNVPVQYTVLVPMKLDGALINGSLYDDIIEGCKVVNLEEHPNLDMILDAVVSQLEINPAFENMFTNMGLAIYEHRKEYPETKMYMSHYAGLLPEIKL